MGKLRVGSGVSRAEDAGDAGRSAATEAMKALGDTAPGLVIVYGAVRYDLPALLAAIREVTGDTPLVGASSSGEFSDGEFLAPGDGMAVMILGAGVYRFGAACVTGLRADGDGAGRDLARAAIAAAGEERSQHGVIMVLADGLVGSLEELLVGIHRVTGAAVPVVGGAAAADRSMKSTYVFFGDQVLGDAAVAVWIGADRPLSVATGHGWETTGLPLLVTKVDGPVVEELGGRPAMEVYQERFSFDDPFVETDDDGVPGYRSAHAFGLVQPDGSFLVRAVFVEDGAIRTFVPIPAYSALQVVAANAQNLLDASAQVVADALEGVPDPAVVLLFSCVARIDLLRERAGEESALMAAAAGPVSTFGFYTYGEFARTAGAGGYHNATVAAVAL